MTDEELIDALRRMSPRLDMLDCENVLTAADRIEAQAAEIKRLRGDLNRAVEAFGCWTRMMIDPAYDMGEMVAEFDAIARTTLADLTGAQKDGN